MAVTVSVPGPEVSPSPCASVNPVGSTTHRQRHSSLSPSASSTWLNGSVMLVLRRLVSPSARQAHCPLISPLATAFPRKTFSSRTSAVPEKSRTAAGAVSSASSPSTVISFSSTAARRTPVMVVNFCSMPPSESAVMSSVLFCA